MDSDWSGGVRLFSDEIPAVKVREDPFSMFPLSEYQAQMKTTERGMWVSGTHGTVTQVVWISRPGTLLVSTLDGSILQLTQNFLDEGMPVAAPEPKAAPTAKSAAKDAPAKKPTFSKVLYRQTDALEHMKSLENPNGVPYLVSSTASGNLLVLDMAAGRTSPLVSKRASYNACSALSTSNTTIAASFHDNTVHLFDSQLAIKLKISGLPMEDPTITSIAQSQSNGNLLAVGTLDEQLILIDVRNASTPVSTMAIGGAIRSAKFSESDALLATAGDSGHVQLWDVSKPMEAPLYEFKHADRATGVHWNPESPGEFVSVAFDGLIVKHHVPKM